MTITIYVLGLVLVFLLNRNGWIDEVFRVSRKTSWFVSGLSLLMISYSATLGYFAYGVIQNSGIWGMWIVWVGIIGSGIVPFVFAPIWQKFNLETDNQFILLRFSGKGAKVLQTFRAFLIGLVVVPILLSMQVIAFGKILASWTGLSESWSLLLTGGILSLFGLKNSFQMKLAHDTYHAMVYFIGLAIIFFSFSDASGGLDAAVSHFRQSRPDALSVFPPPKLNTFWNSLLVLIGVQWWSSQLNDGGGPEMARFTATRKKWDVIKAAAFPVLVTTLLDLVFIAMILMSQSIREGQGETGWIESVFTVVPQSVEPLILLVFFILFTTTAESFLNWGSSLLTVDVYKSKINKNLSAKSMSIVGIGIMVLLSILATVLALKFQSIAFVVTVLLSISTGVSPVLLLRWFWMRINAWSQLSAMLSSLVYTVLLYWLEEQDHPLYQWMNLQPHETRIVVVTVLTTLTWLLVTFLTPPDSKQQINDFRSKLPKSSELIKNFAIAIVFGIVIIALLVGGLYVLI